MAERGDLERAERLYQDAVTCAQVAADALLDAGYDHDEGCYTGQGVMRYIDSSGTETVFWPIVFNIKRSFYHDRLGTDIGKAQNKNAVLSRLGRSDEAAEGASRADGWYLLLLLLLLLLPLLLPSRFGCAPLLLQKCAELRATKSDRKVARLAAKVERRREKEREGERRREGERK